jgi:hypothetical protein
MTAVGSATESSYNGALPVSSLEGGNELLKESIAKVINTLTGSEKTGAGLANERLSEDIIFTAIVHQRLTESNPKLANQLLSELSSRFGKNLRRGRRQPLFRAVDGFLQREIKNGSLARKQKREICKEAFGKAQLHGDNTRMRRRVIPVAGEEEQAQGISNIDATLERVSEGERAARSEMRAFRNRINKRPKLTRSQAERNRTFLDQIDPPESAPIEEKSPGETDKPGDLPTYNDIVTEPNELVYKPESEQGNILIQLPLYYSDQVTDVALFSKSDKELLQLEHTGYGGDGRSYFRGDRPGKDLPGNIYARLDLTDGTYVDIELGNANKFHRFSYEH